MLRIFKNGGFASLVEVIIASVIFTFAAIGIYMGIAALTPKSAQSAKKLQAAYVGKSVVDRLLSEVSATSWSGGGNLDLDRDYTLNNINGTGISVRYRLTALPGYPTGEETPRILNMTVTY